MLIREAAESDAGEIVALLRQIAAASEDADASTMSDEEHLSVIAGCQSFILEDSNAVLGVISIRMIDENDRPDPTHTKIAWVMAFGIDDKHRGKGFGAKLFDYMKGYVTDAGASSIGLSVSPSNVTARAFYEKAGLTSQSIIPRLDEIDSRDSVLEQIMIQHGERRFRHGNSA